ncbi:hypothetical protein ACFQ6C_25830 [Streptomyces sp. NPDC056454]|uniref:hypothetical protein n=1 Tax=Streptomyces sp. NPDC056454 TaxID=3345823 RepID=UPI0036AB4992
MTTTMSPKIAQAAEVLSRAVADAAPALPEFSAVAALLEEEADISLGTARNRLRAAIDHPDSGFHEIRLTAGSYRTWEVRLPGAPAGYGRTWISQANSITFNENEGAHTHGAGKTSWVTTDGRINEIYADQQARVAEDVARRLAETYARAEAELAEMRRRDPDLLTALDLMNGLLAGANGHGGEAEFRFRTPRSGERTAAPLEQQQLIVEVTARTPESIAILKKVLAAGLATYTAEEAAAENVDEGINCLVVGAAAPEPEASGPEVAATVHDRSQVRLLLELPNGAPDTDSPHLPGGPTIRPESVGVVMEPNGQGGWTAVQAVVNGPKVGAKGSVSKREYECPFLEPISEHTVAPLWLQALVTKHVRTINGDVESRPAVQEPEIDDEPAEDDCVLDGEIYPEHDYPPVGEGDECRRCGADAGE